MRGPIVNCWRDEDHESLCDQVSIIDQGARILVDHADIPRLIDDLMNAAEEASAWPQNYDAFERDQTYKED